MVENSLDLIGFERDFAKFVNNLRRVRWLEFWRGKPATRPAGVRPWKQKPVTDRRSGQFGRLSVWVQAGCLGWSGFELGWTPLGRAEEKKQSQDKLACIYCDLM